MDGSIWFSKCLLECPDAVISVKCLCNLYARLLDSFFLVPSFFFVDMLQDQIIEQDEAIQAQLRHSSDASQR